MQHLISDGNIAMLVNSRIFPILRPQDSALPALVVSRQSGDHAHKITGSAGHASPVFHLDCYAASYQAADELAEAVRHAMQGFGGDMGTVAVKSVTLLDDFDGFDAPEDGSDKPAFVIFLRYRILHSESMPAL